MTSCCCCYYFIFRDPGSEEEPGFLFEICLNLFSLIADAYYYFFGLSPPIFLFIWIVTWPISELGRREFTVLLSIICDVYWEFFRKEI